VTGVLLPPEEDSTPEPGSSPQVTFRNVDLGRLRAQLPYDLVPLELWLQDQRPPQPGRLPTSAPLPDLKESPPHLSYAVQWFTFATIALVGYGVLIRKELRERSVAASQTPG
jgi:surfeit locus 1 family protein